MKFQSFLAVVSALVFAIPVHGQGAAGQGRTLKTRCLLFHTDQTLPPVFVHQSVGAKDAVGVPVNVKSYLNHEAESLIMLGDEITFTTSPDRESMAAADKLIGKYKVPAQTRSAILMFLPGDGKPDKPKCSILGIDDSTRAFPRGSVKVINLSHFPLRILLEEKPFEFKSGESKLIENPPVGEANAAGMVAFAFKDNQWQRFSAGLWTHPGQKRVIQVVYEDPVSGQSKITGIRDIAVRDSE